MKAQDKAKAENKKIADKILSDTLLKYRGEFQWYLKQKPGFTNAILDAMESYHLFREKEDVKGDQDRELIYLEIRKAIETEYHKKETDTNYNFISRFARAVLDLYTPLPAKSEQKEVSIIKSKCCDYPIIDGRCERCLTQQKEERVTDEMIDEASREFAHNDIILDVSLGRTLEVVSFQEGAKWLRDKYEGSNH